MMLHAPEIDRARPQRRTPRLPERVSGHWRMLLVIGDAAVVLFVALVVLNGDGNRVAGAILMAAIVCGIAWLCGLYRRSYAVTPFDETYYAIAIVTFGAVPAGVLLGAVGNFGVLSIVLALLFCAVGMSALRVRLHLERRVAAPYAGLDSITPGAWHDRESTGFRSGKRLFDLLVAVPSALILMPLMLAAAAAIAIESGTPVLFRQERVGENGRPFWIMKFRTMRKDAGGHWAKPGDDRISRLGSFLRRSSIDELPQLFNVIRGEMSMVGPRPEMVAFAQSFSHRIPNYDQRHVVAPGMTGWAQVYLNRNLDPDDIPGVLPYDLFYVEYASPLMDCALIFKTAFELRSHRAV